MTTSPSQPTPDGAPSPPPPPPDRAQSQPLVDGAPSPDPAPSEPSPDPAQSQPSPDRGQPQTTVLDCLGQRCPLPVIALARALPGVAVGTTVRVLADDPAAATDIPAWCRMKGQEYLGSPTPSAHEVRRIN